MAQPLDGPAEIDLSFLNEGANLTPHELECYLHDHIPLSKAMQVSVISAQLDEIVLSAPLAPNINHRETVFGGSSSALAILAAWSLIHFRLRSEGLNPRLVIKRNSVNYLRPMTGSFEARSSLHDKNSWDRFTKTLVRKGLARIAARCSLECAGQPVGQFEGEFVALRAEKA